MIVVGWPAVWSFSVVVVDGFFSSAVERIAWDVFTFYGGDVHDREVVGVEVVGVRVDLFMIGGFVCGYFNFCRVFSEYSPWFGQPSGVVAVVVVYQFGGCVVPVEVPVSSLCTQVVGVYDGPVETSFS